MPILNILNFLTQPIRTIAKGFFSLQQEKQKTHLAIQKNKTRLALDTQSNNHDWEMAQLQGRDNILRRLCFCILMTPFIWAIFDAQAVKYYFDVALQAMPKWYVQIVVIMIGAIWGIRQLSYIICDIKKSVTSTNNKK